MDSCERDMLVRLGSAFYRQTLVALMIFVLAAVPKLAAVEGSEQTSPPTVDLREQAPDLALSPSAIDTVRFDFDTNLQGWSFLTGVDSVQEYYPDYSCQQQWRMILNGNSFGLTWYNFNGSGTARVYAPFNGYYSNDCSYSWRIKSMQTSVPSEWQGCQSLQARLYKSGTDVIYAMIGYRRTGETQFNYIGWSSALTNNGWSTVTLNEPSTGAFADLEAISIMFGAYYANAYVYVDRVWGIKNAPATPVLISPSNGVTIQDNLPTFQWTGDADYYTLEIADNSDFGEPTVYNGITGTQFTVTSPLPNSVGYYPFSYYWRVKGYYNGGVSGSYSTAYSLNIDGPHEVPSEFPTIRAAYNAFQHYSGGTILIAPGTYNGPDNCNIGGFGEKPTTIIGTGGPEVTIIDCQGDYRGFFYDMYAGSGSRLEGLTIRNTYGNGDEYGAVSCWSASPRIKNCIFEGGSVKAITCRSGAQPIFEDCIIRNTSGDGVLIWNAGMPRFINCEISNNTGAGIRLISAGSADLDSCSLIMNGTGMYFETKYGGGLITYISNSIIAYSKTGPAVNIISLDNDIVFNCSDLYGNKDGDWIGDILASQFGVRGNFSDRPEFCDPSESDYTLFDTSPCAPDAGACGRIGAYGVACESNQAPALAAIGGKSVAEGQLLTFGMSASDPDDDPLAFSAAPMPQGAQLIDHGNNTATFSWTPTYDQAGYYLPNISVSDGSLLDEEVVLITVTETNRPPVLAEIGGKAVLEGNTLSFPVTATDPDNQALSITASGLPNGAVFVDSGNGAGSFVWTPGYDQAGNYPIEFAASDGSLQDSEQITIAVTETNLPPVLAAIGNKTIPEGLTLSVRVTASDPDGQAVILSASGIPLGAAFVDSGNGVAGFSWTPAFDQSGNYPIEFVASDGLLADTASVIFGVTNVNQAPVLAPIGNKTVTETNQLSFAVSASDPDEQPVTISATPLPSGAAFVDSGNGRGGFTWTPAVGQLGSYSVTFSASDGNLSDTEPVTITVNTATQCILTPDSLDMGSTTDSKEFYIKNEGTTLQDWSATEELEWLTLTPSNGQVSPGDSNLVTISVDRAMTMEGSHLATIQVSFDVGSAALPVTMYTPIRPLFVADQVGIQMNETIRVPLNGLAQETSVRNSLQINSTNPGASFDVSLATEDYSGQAVTVVYISPAGGGEFDELDVIDIIFQPGIQGGTGVPSAVSHTGTVVSGADTWPGDTNDDGLVDERDLLPIGLYFSKTGPAREQSGLTWRRCMASVMNDGLNWQPARAVYADADGSGAVDAMDICALSENWAAKATGTSPSREPDMTALSELGQSTLEELYQAVIECPESRGKEILRDMLAAQVSAESPSAPGDYRLYQNRPNPFNPSTTIEFNLPEAAYVRLEVYNLAGQLVATMLDRNMPNGRHAVEFDGYDQASGVYFYRLTAGNFVESRKMLLLK